MSRRWLLSLLCLSVSVLCLVPLTRAGGDVRVNEADTKFLLDKDPAEVVLAIENSTGKTMDARVVVELLDPNNHSKAKTTQLATIATGTQKLSLFLPMSFSRLSAIERSNILAGQIEATAVVIQALTKACNPNCEADTKLINRGLLYLLKQKDRYGVWYSTQTTINVLDAMLTLFSTKASSQSTNSTADVLVNGRAAQTVQMPVGERLNNPITVDISQSLNAGKNRIEIKRSGSLQFASVQAVANYYVPWSA